MPTTLLSVGNLELPHVVTSAGVPDDALLILDKTNLNCAADEQRVLLTAGKFTFSQVLAGKYGFPDATRVCVTLVERAV